MEYEQTGVAHPALRHRGIGYVIHRFLNRGIGIEVGTKLYAVALTPVAYGVCLTVATVEVLGTVKRHVLKEVRQSPLLRLLQYAAHTLGYVEISLTRSLVVMTNKVCQSVAQLTHLHVRVLWQRSRNRNKGAHKCAHEYK